MHSPHVNFFWGLVPLPGTGTHNTHTQMVPDAVAPHLFITYPPTNVGDTRAYAWMSLELYP